MFFEKHGFLIDIAKRTGSMLLATAISVQIHPIEAWKLLYILSQGNEFVLGDDLSQWQRESNKGLNQVTGREELATDYEKWDWLRNPPREMKRQVPLVCFAGRFIYQMSNLQFPVPTVY